MSKKTITTLSPDEFRVSASMPNAQIVDLRMLGETAGERIHGANLLTFQEQTFAASSSILDKARPVLLYCLLGERSKKAMEILKRQGFTNVSVLDGGLQAWKAAGQPTERALGEFWDKMYSVGGYLYGKEPNAFFVSALSKLPPGAVLFPAEGEGRNAVYAAAHGWQASAFDISAVGQQKAHALATEVGVTIDYKLADFGDPQLASNHFDVIALIYSHVPPEVRRKGHKALAKALRPGGTMIVECFSANHLKINSMFGPKTPDIMYQIEDLKTDFAGFTFDLLEEVTIDLEEGRHAGKGVVTRMIARKPLVESP